MTAPDTTASHHQWGPTPTWMWRWNPKPALVAEAPDGARLEFYTRIVDDGVNANFVVHTPEGETHSTDSTEEWPHVEAYIPRAKWPEEIYAGKKNTGPRRPDQAVAEAIQAERSEYQALLAEEH